MVCPRPESCGTPGGEGEGGALLSVTPNPCYDETKNQGAYTCLTLAIHYHSMVVQANYRLALVRA